MAKTKIDWWVIVVIAILAYAFVPSVKNFVDGLTGKAAPTTTTPTTTTPGLISIPCTIEDTTITLDSYNKYAKNTEVTNGSHLVFINEDNLGYYAEGGQPTASPGDTYRIIFGENSTSHYSAVKTGEIGCKGTVTLAMGLAQYDTSPTFTLWTENAQVMSNSVTQAMDASSTYDIPIKIQATTKFSIGNPNHQGNGNVLCTIYDKSRFDIISVDGATAAPTPNAVAPNTSQSASCYYIPVIPNSPDDNTDGQWTGSLLVDTSANNPDIGQSPYVYIFDTDVDLDADNLDVIEGVQDETNNDLGVAGQTFGQGELNTTLWVS